ncbi:hypothetical protein ABES25_18410 [Bacillus gobiensis]|uniref:hypothetical protein n=1 Tax=Bacillus gobiensis TaxID=1441095 RepID=UPI003D228D40
MNKQSSRQRKFEEHVTGASIAFDLLFIVLPLALVNYINAFDEPFLKTTSHYLGLLSIDLIFVLLYIHNSRLSKGFEKYAYLLFFAVLLIGLVANAIQFFKVLTG